MAAGTGLISGCSYDENNQMILLTAQLKWEIMDISGVKTEF
jgi:hypothetical protein